MTSARLAADTLGVPLVIIARTDALGANLITSDIDDIDENYLKNLEDLRSDKSKSLRQSNLN